MPIPTQLFQGSLLLGTIASTVLGEGAMRSSNVLIHPLLIGGWCGLVATALNSLPVGSLDGGKMTQVLHGVCKYHCHCSNYVLACHDHLIPLQFWHCVSRMSACHASLQS